MKYQFDCRERKRETLKSIERSILVLTAMVEQGNEEIMGTLADLATRLETLDAKSSEVATWVDTELAALREQLVLLADQVTGLEDALAQNALDVEQIDALGVLVDDITATVDAIDDPEVGPQPDDPMGPPDGEVIA